MTLVRTVSVALIASMLITALPVTTWAGDEVAASPASVNLRAAIDRAAAKSVAKARDVAPPATRHAARARQGVGGGGGSMMIWTVVGTVTSLAATYFIVKEMRKQTDTASEQ